MKVLLAELAARAAVAVVVVVSRGVVAWIESRERRAERSSYRRHMDEDAQWRAQQMAEGRKF